MDKLTSDCCGDAQKLLDAADEIALLLSRLGLGKGQSIKALLLILMELCDSCDDKKYVFEAVSNSLDRYFESRLNICNEFKRS